MGVEAVTVMIGFTIARRYAFLFQVLLEGEEGLAVVRCMDPDKSVQQLWVPYARQGELAAWLQTVPEHWGFHALWQKEVA